MLGVGTFDPYGDTPNPLLVQAQVDTDPYSPTYGQPLYRKLSPKETGPDYQTTQKGNPGQPGASVPTTAQGNTGATFEMVPPPGTPQKTPKAAPAAPAKETAPQDTPDIFDTMVPQATPSGAPKTAAPAKTGEGDIFDTMVPQATASGAPITPAYTGQYLTSATSPGAQATGTPIVDDPARIPGSDFQRQINLAEDPGQKAAIAANLLKIPMDRIIVSGSGRLAAVDEKGQPYYIETERPFVNQAGITRDEPGTPWRPTGTFQFSPYATQSPLTPATPTSASPANLAAGGAIALQNLGFQLPAVAGAMISAPVGAAVGTGGGTYVGSAGRQMLANALTEQPEYRRDPFTAQRGKDALFNALLAYGGGLVGPSFAPEARAFTSAGADVLPSARLGGFRGIPIGQQANPFGLPDRYFPWETTPRGTASPWEVAPLQREAQLLPERNALVPPPPVANPLLNNPPGPPPPGARIQPPPVSEAPPIASAVPAEHPAFTPPVPPAAAGEIPTPEAEGVPGLKTPEQITAEQRQVPSDVPPLRFPIMSQAGARARAVQLLQHYAQGGNITPEVGATGTLSEITGNQGIATLERAMRDNGNPAIINDIASKIEETRAANRAALEVVRGHPDDLLPAEQAVSRQIGQLKTNVFTNAQPADLEGTLNAVDAALASPEAAGNPTVAAALRDVRARLFQRDPITGRLPVDADGKPIEELISDPETAWRVRSGVGHDMSSRAQSGSTDIRAASRELGPVLAALDKDITAAAPNYAGFNAAVKELNKPITAMNYLQGRTGLVDAYGNPTLSGVQRTLDDIYKQRTLKYGWQPADDLTDVQISGLEALRDQLRRQQNVSRPIVIGSPTYQKFGTDQTLNLLTGQGPIARTMRPMLAGSLATHEFGPVVGPVLGTGHMLFQAGVAARNMSVRDQINAELTRLLLNRNGEGLAALRAGTQAGP